MKGNWIAKFGDYQPGVDTPLDKAFRIIRIGRLARMCDHIRTEIIARRDGVDYLECLDCRQVFEAEDLEPVPADDEEEE